ncbi:MAG: hypothetical protein HY586_04450 [Candidatus Omnitrophica bacterium]|nr:hypothetical protein [Candidatus Omnitrophota bacterium]
MKILAGKVAAAVSLFSFIITLPVFPSSSSPTSLTSPTSVSGSVISQKFLSQNAPTLYLIQDAHAHPEAQEKICEILKYLAEEQHVQTIFVEGASLVLDRRALTFTGDPFIDNALARELAETGLLSGAEQLMRLPEGAKLSFLGLENETLYQLEKKYFRQTYRNSGTHIPRRLARFRDVLTLRLTRQQWGDLLEPSPFPLPLKGRGENLQVFPSPAERERAGVRAAYSFYLLACERENVFMHKITEHFQSSGQKSAAVVTGGFHTEGLAELAEARRYNYVVIQPRLTQIPDDKKYRREALRSETMALKPISAGERFREPPAEPRGTQHIVAVLKRKLKQFQRNPHPTLSLHRRERGKTLDISFLPENPLFSLSASSNSSARSLGFLNFNFEAELDRALNIYELVPGIGERDRNSGYRRVLFELGRPRYHRALQRHGFSHESAEEMGREALFEILMDPFVNWSPARRHAVLMLAAFGKANLLNTFLQWEDGYRKAAFLKSLEEEVIPMLAEAEALFQAKRQKPDRLGLNPREIQPPLALPLSGRTDLKESAKFPRDEAQKQKILRDLAIEAIAQGKLAILEEHSRLESRHSDKPKSALSFHVVLSQTLLERRMEQIFAMQRFVEKEKGLPSGSVRIPLVIMTTAFTHHKTKQLLESFLIDGKYFGLIAPEEVRIVKQRSIPQWDPDNGDYYVSPGGQILLSSYGDGDATAHILRRKDIREFLAGVETVLFVENDNPMAMPSLRTIGFHVSEVARLEKEGRVPGEEIATGLFMHNGEREPTGRMGHLVSIQHEPRVIEPRTLVGGKPFAESLFPYLYHIRPNDTGGFEEILQQRNNPFEMYILEESPTDPYYLRATPFGEILERLERGEKIFPVPLTKESDYRIFAYGNPKRLIFAIETALYNRNTLTARLYPINPAHFVSAFDLVNTNIWMFHLPSLLDREYTGPVASLRHHSGRRPVIDPVQGKVIQRKTESAVLRIHANPNAYHIPAHVPGSRYYAVIKPAHDSTPGARDGRFEFAVQAVTRSNLQLLGSLGFAPSAKEDSRLELSSLLQLYLRKEMLNLGQISLEEGARLYLSGINLELGSLEVTPHSSFIVNMHPRDEDQARFESKNGLRIEGAVTIILEGNARLALGRNVTLRNATVRVHAGETLEIPDGYVLQDPSLQQEPRPFQPRGPVFQWDGQRGHVVYAMTDGSISLTHAPAKVEVFFHEGIQWSDIEKEQKDKPANQFKAESLGKGTVPVKGLSLLDRHRLTAA